MICPTCGSNLPDGAAFCPNCGSTISPQPQQPSQQGYQQMPQPSYPGPAPSYFGEPVPQKKSKTPLIIGIVAGVVALIAIALLVVFVVLPAVNGGSGDEKGDAPVANEQKVDEEEPKGVHSSAEAIAEEMTRGFQGAIDDGFSSDSLSDWMDGVLDLMPEDVLEAALDESGMSRSEFRDYMGEMFASSGVDSFGALLDYVDMEVAFEVGDELSSSELDDLNSTFSDDAGVDVEVTSGYHLSMEMTMTLLEDMNGYEAGETESQTQDVSGAYAIEIDGAWYVWMG